MICEECLWCPKGANIRCGLPLRQRLPIRRETINFCSKYDTVSQSKKGGKVAMKEGLVFSTGAAEVAQCFEVWVVG